MRVLQITAYSGWGCTGRIAVGIHNALINQNQECSIAWGRVNTAADAVMTVKIGNKFDQNMHGLYTRITDKCGFGSRVHILILFTVKNGKLDAMTVNKKDITQQA